MAVEPKPGLVIRYDYLWRDEQRAGAEQGRKDRPCAVILTSKPKEDGSRNVILCPITHSPPQKGESAVEIPPAMSRHLKLDDERSWIKTHEVNELRWEKERVPYGVVPAYKGQQVFGEIHSSLGKKAFDQVHENYRKRTLAVVKRD